MDRSDGFAADLP